MKFSRARRDEPWYHIGPVLAAAKTETKPKTDDGTDKKTPTSADVYVFEGIGGWFGVTSSDFVRDVASLDVDELVLHLNSPGGDVAEGVAIANVLRAHRATVTVRVDGLAASAASVIAMAGDEVVMGVGAQLMVHDPWTISIGNAADLSADVRMLNSMGDSLAATYAAKAGGTAADWRAVMEAEAWYSAEEAVEAGLADRVAAADETGTAKGQQVTPGSAGSLWDAWDSLSRSDRHDLSIFSYAGRAAAPAPPMPARMTPAADAARTDKKEGGCGVAFSDEQLSTLRQHLGLADDADEQAIYAAAVAPRPDPETAKLPPGTELVESTVLAELRTSAELGRAAHARQAADDRAALVEAAVRDGRIAPARRDHWNAQLAADPGSAEVLASLAPGLIPVAEIGHAGEGGDPEADSLYASVFGKDA